MSRNRGLSPNSEGTSASEIRHEIPEQEMKDCGVSEERGRHPYKTLWILISAWLLVGQFAMLLVHNQYELLTGLADKARWVRYAFPTIGKIDSRYVFSETIGASYLTVMALIFPVLLLILFKMTPRELMDVNAKPLKKFALVYAFIYGALALYSAHFRWDDGFFVRLFGWSPYGFSIAGALLLFLTGYSIRAAQICFFLNGDDK